ncbi:unnamed protein product [Schistosoma margrebowiei]|uniref:Uncharacterized protein n=1 Tax=Schistosoma margrebowiei TaxID=48269 RepID=A0A183M2C7_9TREM|nr:unnamed protein product [Schistosoma margrebowiei]
MNNRGSEEETKHGRSNRRSNEIGRFETSINYFMIFFFLI